MENETLKDYFTRYPNNDEVFENSGVLFHTRGAADSFGNAKETARYTRAKVMTVDSELSTVDLEKKAAEDEARIEAAKTAAIELLQATDVETLDYNAMKTLAKDLQLVTADKKAETLKVALTEYKTTLNAE